jgi:hypothetical protein
MRHHPHDPGPQHRPPHADRHDDHGPNHG